MSAFWLVLLPWGHMSHLLQAAPLPPWGAWGLLTSVSGLGVTIAGWALKKVVNHGERTGRLEATVHGDGKSDGLVNAVAQLKDAQAEHSRMLERILEAVTGDRGIKWSVTRMEEHFQRVANTVTAQGAMIQNNTARIDDLNERVNFRE